MKRLIIFILLFSAYSAAASAEGPSQDQPEPTPMSNQRLQSLIEGMADEVEGRPGYWQFTISDFSVTVITDENADRMRIIVPIARTENVNSDNLVRLMQANFDSALDARYSLAKGILWSAYIHPLSALSDHQFIDGLAQAVNLASTYGTTYSSGALVFGGGDSKAEQDKYYREIIERGSSI